MTSVEDHISIVFPCIRLKQPIGEFYIARMSYTDLCKIAHFDVRRVIQEKRDVERYLGIQRPLNPRRVKDLEKYVNTFDATFPTSIIIAVEAVCAEFNEDRGTMSLSNYVGDEGEKPIYFRYIARVIDGQHRIAGLYEFSGEGFDLSITIFVAIDIADQAHIFSTVNLEQTKVNRSLAYDLFALAKSRSPQKTCHNVAIALDQDESGPFYKRIKRLGVATEGRFTETITQATFVRGLLGYISKDPMMDRDTLIRGKKLTKPNPDELEELPFRNWFIDEEDIKIAEIIWNFFDAVRKKWSTAWNAMDRGLMLNRTNGFRACMRLLRPVYLHCARPGEMVSSDQFLKVLARCKLRDQDFTTERFQPGTSGEAELYRTLLKETDLE